MTTFFIKIWLDRYFKNDKNDRRWSLVVVVYSLRQFFILWSAQSDFPLEIELMSEEGSLIVLVDYVLL